jgi:hypothetical protein
VRDGSTAQFRVTPHETGLGHLLVSMGFPRVGGHFVRSFPDSADIPRLFDNFASHVDEMIRHERRDTPAPWEHALEVVVARLSGQVDWWLAGSAALEIRGIGVRPRDLDLVVGDARRTGELFGDRLIEPVRRMRGWVADWHGRAFDEALIEWAADMHADIYRAGAHEDVVWRGHKIPCSPLEPDFRV